GDVDNLDPQVSTWSGAATLGNLVYDSLVYEDPDRDAFVPGLAASWEVSSDATTYTFHLRKDVKFHDGTPFNAKAVQVNFDRILDPATKAQAAAALFGQYDKTEVVDELTAKVVFKQPFGMFLDSASRTTLG